ncbi:hypothetical protein HZA87_02345 [Candidatus Uhrbacteria bacterium]|nr:hypothetical protein [Candidatus Uhrbacteria bacterium]
MISETGSMWGNGAITLPKKWRTKFKTRHFMFIEVSEGLLVKPIEEIEYYEQKDGTVGLRFPGGIEMHDFLDLFKKASREVAEEESSKRKSVRKKSRKK